VPALSFSPQAQAGVPAEATAGDVVLVADDAARQGLATGLPERRIGHPHHPGGGTQVGGLRPVHARAGDHALARGERPLAFGEQAGIAQLGVVLPRQVPVRLADRTALALPAALAFHASRQSERGPGPPGRDPPAIGAAIHVGGHRHRHRAHRVGIAQGEVVHHVVGFVAVHAGLQGARRTAVKCLLGAQSQAVSPELRAIHAAAGVTRDPIAAAQGGFQHGVFVRRQAQRKIGIPLAPPGWHHLAIAVLVVAGFGTGHVGSKAQAAGHGVLPGK